MCDVSRADFIQLDDNRKIVGRLLVYYDTHDNPIEYGVWTSQTKSELYSKSIAELEVKMALRGLKLVHVTHDVHGFKNKPAPKCCYAVEV